MTVNLIVNNGKPDLDAYRERWQDWRDLETVRLAVAERLAGFYDKQDIIQIELGDNGEWQVKPNNENA